MDDAVEDNQENGQVVSVDEEANETKVTIGMSCVSSVLICDL